MEDNIMEVKSMAKVKYSYNLDGINLTGLSQSNIVNTEVRKLGITVKKLSNSEFYRPNDIISYTIILTNTGNFRTNNVVIEDDITNQNYILSSLKFYSLGKDLKNSLIEELQNNKLILKIPFIDPNEIYVITYRTIIGPDIEKINSSLSLISDEIKEKEQSEVSLTQGYAQIECIKNVSNNITYLNSDLSYILKIKNNGNISAFNVEVFDELPITYELDKTNPVTINNLLIDYQYQNNILNFTIPEIKPNNDIEVLINGRIIK